MALGIRQGVIHPALAFSGYKNAHLSPVSLILPPLDQTGFCHSVDNLRHGGLALKGVGGKFTDGHAVAVAQAGKDAPFGYLQTVRLKVHVKLRTDFRTCPCK